MSYPQPVAPGRQLPRGHLLVFYRSFRRTLEAENKSPQDHRIEAYTDAVRLLVGYLAGLLKTCEGRDFTSRGDIAMILLVDTGMRRAECVGMTLEDVDLDQRIVWVLGKGRQPRAPPIDRKTA